MKKKVIVCLLVTCYLLPLLAGCSNKSSGDSSEKSGGNGDSKGKGRYIETEITLSDKEDQRMIESQLLMPDGSVGIYTTDYSKPGSISLTKYHYDSNKSSCEKEKPEWLQNIPIPSSPFRTQVLQGVDGTQYLFWVDSKEGYLYKTTDGKTRSELSMEGWKPSTSEDQPEVQPIAVGILENGMLVANSKSGCYLYDLQSGKQIKQITEEFIAAALTVASNKFAIISMGNVEETMTDISIYNADKPDEKPEVVHFEEPITLDTSIFLNKAGDLTIANKEGIHVLLKGTGTWQTMVDGTLNTMNIPNIICNNVLQDNKENFYIIYKDEVTLDSSIMRYHFDKTVNAVPAHELAIYTLEDNTLLRAAASTFQKTHNDYKVTIRVAMDGNSALTKEDYIRSLNTELLNGSGCDLILLDGLPLEDYIEKGVLSDLSSVIDPMRKENALLSNVVKSYYSVDKIYAIPTRIKLPSIYGKAATLQACDTLDHMATYAKARKGKPLSGAYTYDNIVDNFLPSYMHNIKTADGQISADGMKGFLEDIKAILDNTGCIAEYTEQSRMPYFLDLPVNAEIYMGTATNLMTMGITLSFTHYVNGDFAPFENAYEPANILGINKASTQQEAAKEFLECMLSDEIQMQDMEGMGFPVKLKALENMKVAKWWDGVYPIEKNDGTQIEVPLSDISAADKEKLISYCKQVTERAYTDDNILKAVKELGKNYVLSEEPIDKTVDLIMNKLSIYNEE